MPDYVKSDIKLSIGMLVSNRKKYIRKVMDSIMPLLEAVPSELIIIDTKGEETDGSIDIVKEYTDNIFCFKWCDDFAAARNAYMERAKGEWVFTLDDDECFDEDIHELVDFFCNGESDNYGAAYLDIINYMAKGATSITQGGRLIRRTAKTRYIGRVHERYNEVHEPFKALETRLHHYGYYFATDEESKRHQERNVRLLQKELSEGRMSIHNCAQMMQELLSRKETIDAAYSFFQKTMSGIQTQELSDACAQWMLVASVRCFKAKKDFEGMLAQAKYIKENYQLSQVAQCALAGVVIETTAPKGIVKVILEYAPLYREAWKWLQENKEMSITQYQLDFSKYVTQSYAIQVFQVAAACANAIKDYKDAFVYWNLLPWDDPSFDGSKYLTGMQETLRGLENEAAGGTECTLSL